LRIYKAKEIRDGAVLSELARVFGGRERRPRIGWDLGTLYVDSGDRVTSGQPVTVDVAYRRAKSMFGSLMHVFETYPDLHVFDHVMCFDKYAVLAKCGERLVGRFREHLALHVHFTAEILQHFFSVNGITTEHRIAITHADASAASYEGCAGWDSDNAVSAGLPGPVVFALLLSKGSREQDRVVVNVNAEAAKIIAVSHQKHADFGHLAQSERGSSVYFDVLVAKVPGPFREQPGVYGPAAAGGGAGGGGGGAGGGGGTGGGGGGGLRVANKGTVDVPTSPFMAAVSAEDLQLKLLTAPRSSLDPQGQITQVLLTPVSVVEPNQELYARRDIPEGMRNKRELPDPETVSRLMASDAWATTTLVPGAAGPAFQRAAYINPNLQALVPALTFCQTVRTGAAPVVEEMFRLCLIESLEAPKASRSDGLLFEKLLDLRNDRSPMWEGKDVLQQLHNDLSGIFTRYLKLRFWCKDSGRKKVPITVGNNILDFEMMGISVTGSIREGGAFLGGSPADAESVYLNLAGRCFFENQEAAVALQDVLTKAMNDAGGAGIFGSWGSPQVWLADFASSHLRLLLSSSLDPSNPVVYETVLSAEQNPKSAGWLRAKFGRRLLEKTGFLTRMRVTEDAPYVRDKETATAPDWAILQIVNRTEVRIMALKYWARLDKHRRNEILTIKQLMRMVLPKANPRQWPIKLPKALFLHLTGIQSLRVVFTRDNSKPLLEDAKYVLMPSMQVWNFYKDNNDFELQVGFAASEVEK
jgi:hypothetical protein